MDREGDFPHIDEDGGLPPLDHTVRDRPRYVPGGARANYGEGVIRRREFLLALDHDMTVQEAMDHVGIRLNGLKAWRMRNPDFKREMDMRTMERSIKEDPLKKEADLTFEEFRAIYLKTPTPAYQREITQAYQNTPPGNILMVLIPPAHGKTTLFEDYACYKLAMNPNYRMMVGGGTQRLSAKVLGRVKNRMEPTGPYRHFVEKFGPFAPENNSGRKSRQPWGANFFNVHKKNTHDERDYSMAAIGFTGDIVGTRTDQLHLDDLQAVQTLSRTEQMLDKLRQDWFTRPGEEGFTTINGTRVGDGDVYEGLIDQFGEDPLFKLIKMPAIVHDDEHKQRPLWLYDPKTKAGFTMEMLERLRKKVGEDAWARNYMQQPRAKSSGTFSEAIIDQCMNPQRRAGEVAVPGAPFFISLDPALGGINCLMSVQVTPEKLYIVDIQEDTGLVRNEQIMARLESMCLQIQSMGGAVTDCVIEAKNFQLGLARDTRLQEIADKYRFSLREHMTGVNKYAEDIGVPTMATSFSRRQIDIPCGDDPRTREMAAQFRNQLLKWRMYAKGNQLRQDQVMACWFAWILWDVRRRQSHVDTDSFKQAGLPWTKSNAGLIVPSRSGSPFYAMR